MTRDTSGAIFITGATGLLGNSVALAMLERGHDVWLLARGTGKLSAQQRIDRSMLEVFPSWEAYEPVRQRIHVLEGDVTEPLFGLDAERYGELKDSISAVVHCAALLNFLPDQREAVFGCNLEGNFRAHEVARDAGLETVHMVSTAYVCGVQSERGEDGRRPQLETPCVGERVFNNSYEESKFRAEQLIDMIDKATGIKSTFYRPSCILGDYTTGRTITFKTLYGFIDLIDQERIRLLRQDKINPMDKKLIYFSNIPKDATRNIVPVDWVADTIAHIVDTPDQHGRIFHLTNPNPPDRWEVNRWIARAVGFEDLLMPSEAAKYSTKDLVSLSPGRLGRFQQVFNGYLEDHEPVFDDTNTRAALAGTGRSCPVIDHAYIERVVRYCLDSRWRNDVERRLNEVMKDR